MLRSYGLLQSQLHIYLCYSDFSLFIDQFKDLLSQFVIKGSQYQRCFFHIQKVHLE